MKADRSASRWVLRALAGAVMFTALTGPAPGNIGGCGSNTEVADPHTYCVDRHYWFCRRDEFAAQMGIDPDRVTPEQTQLCHEAIPSTCAGSTVWPTGCEPTNAQTMACITLLSRGDLAGVTTPELLASHPDCNLCM